MGCSAYSGGRRSTNVLSQVVLYFKFMLTCAIPMWHPTPEGLELDVGGDEYVMKSTNPSMFS